MSDVSVHGAKGKPIRERALASARLRFGRVHELVLVLTSLPPHAPVVENTVDAMKGANSSLKSLSDARSDDEGRQRHREPHYSPPPSLRTDPARGDEEDEAGVLLAEALRSTRSAHCAWVRYAGMNIYCSREISASNGYRTHVRTGHTNPGRSDVLRVRVVTSMIALGVLSLACVIVSENHWHPASRGPLLYLYSALTGARHDPRKSS
ncbi:hypothetical protein K488DRAFT_74976 [Vararia minispora EC-137]|uniref:Uncharacterized protein n=1 Tax=Vararia minispora EC-137 TaxID=1314806 RepID=A0ACB8Q5C1_9AGAM|nr:hypothetical protein K488DRAFT_74976 [Vararia minispora EC-137]